MRRLYIRCVRVARIAREIRYNAEKGEFELRANFTINYSRFTIY